MMQINKILFITLSNIGDCILTLPVLDVLVENFPSAKITVLTGPRPKEIFQDNPLINRLIIYDKHSGLGEKIKLFNALKKENFDLVVDLRNSFLGAFLPARYKTSAFLIVPKQIRHMKDRHLYRLSTLYSLLSTRDAIKRNSLHIKPEDGEYIKNILRENKVTEQDSIIVVSAGARSHIKRWAQDKFVELISSLLKEFGVKVVLVGDKDDIPITKYITEHSSYPIVDLSAKTTITQLAYLLKKSKLVITNDSAILHLASYLDIPLVAIFGPTDEIKYGPWSKIYFTPLHPESPSLQAGDEWQIKFESTGKPRHLWRGVTGFTVKKDIFCRPCAKAQCRFGTLKCMQLIRVEDVLRQVKQILENREQRTENRTIDLFRRILIVRTDRIGDVLLSTPVIKTLRDNYPYAYIAMMVSPYGKSIVEGNPYLDEVIVYDKEGSHKSWLRSIKFAHNLKKKRFDLALILHPTNRVHLVTFFAGICRRVGYDRKFGFLLTDRIKHTKQLGQKHESEYTLDLVRYLGIEPKDQTLFMPIKPESEAWVEELFKQQEIKETNRLLAIHPGASCPSKIWPHKRFAEVASRLIERYGFKVLVIAGPKDMALAENVIKYMRYPAINLSGKTSVSQLASVLKRCDLFISCDSGPVHIAASVGAPVISIFGRNQKGLSPTRWGPTGKKDKVLHKEVGCIECLAHNCTKDFVCLKAITVDDVLSAADAILKS